MIISTCADDAASIRNVVQTAYPVHHCVCALSFIPARLGQATYWHLPQQGARR